MIRHVDWDPSTEPFKPHAVLGKPPAYFEKEKGIVFTDGLDGLDYFEAAAFLKDDRTRFVLKRYRGNAQNTTSIYLEPFLTDIEYITRTVEEIVADLGLTSLDIVWQRKDNPEA